MKAAVATSYGPPEVVRVVEVPRPVLSADDLLVRVQASTVNRTDCGFRAGHPWFIRGFSGVTKPKRTILGNEFAGIVEAVGDDVSRFGVGDRVFGYDDTRFGCHAEQLAISQDAAIAAMPDGRDFEVMAPATEGSHYALAYLRAAGVDDSSEVLVYGATGAIGSSTARRPTSPPTRSDTTSCSTQSASARSDSVASCSSRTGSGRRPTSARCRKTHCSSW
jgi:NADPH:quinone reductase-like Zn-dependent oxidoreductase